MGAHNSSFNGMVSSNETSSLSTTIMESPTTTTTTTTTKDNVSYLNCFSIFDDIVYVSVKDRGIILFFYFIVTIINVITNGLCIFINVVTGHWKNQSMRIILYVSISDILNAILGNGSHILLILIPNRLDCQMRRFLIFVPHIFSYFSSYSVLFLGLDRFLHVMLLSRYKRIIKPVRFNCLMTIYLTIGLCQAFLTTYGPKLFGKGSGARYSAPVNNLFVFATVVTYIASIIKLKIYSKTSRTVSTSTMNINKLTTAFLTIITITYSPIILSSIFADRLTNRFGAANTNILAHSLLLWAKCNSGLNAIAYLRLNGRARNRVNAIIQRQNDITTTSH